MFVVYLHRFSVNSVLQLCYQVSQCLVVFSSCQFHLSFHKMVYCDDIIFYINFAYTVDIAFVGQSVALLIFVFIEDKQYFILAE